eukprot:COSAG06_NODE_43580_length_370_cov_2.051661_1_plen_69_part_00
MESVFAGGMEPDSDTEAAEAMAVRTPFQLSLRLSRGCLGKMIVYVYKVLKKGFFGQNQQSSFVGDDES